MREDVGVDHIDDVLLEQPEAHAVDDAHVGDGEAQDLYRDKAGPGVGERECGVGGEMVMVREWEKVAPGRGPAPGRACRRRRGGP